MVYQTCRVDGRSAVALTTATASEPSICCGDSVVKYARLVRTYTAVTMGREMMMARGRFLTHRQQVKAAAVHPLVRKLQRETHL